MGFIEWIKLITGIEQFNAHMNATKIINDEYKYTIEQQRNRIKELESMKGNPISSEDFEILLEREKEYHEQIIELMTETRDLKEFIIFAKLINKDNGNKEKDNQTGNDKKTD